MTEKAENPVAEMAAEASRAFSRGVKERLYLRQYKNKESINPSNESLKTKHDGREKEKPMENYLKGNCSSGHHSGRSAGHQLVRIR